MRSSPSTGELLTVGKILGLTKTSTRGEVSRRVADALKLGLADDVVLDLSLEVGVVALTDKCVHDGLEHKSSISGPVVEV